MEPLPPSDDVIEYALRKTSLFLVPVTNGRPQTGEVFGMALDAVLASGITVYRRKALKVPDATVLLDFISIKNWMFNNQTMVLHRAIPQGAMSPPTKMEPTNFSLVAADPDPKANAGAALQLQRVMLPDGMSPDQSHSTIASSDQKVHGA
jgi:hypothetical protein